MAVGFKTVSAAAFIGEHSFSKTLAAGRPDSADMALAEEFAEKTAEKLKGTALENIPFIGTLSQFGGLSSFADEKKFYPQIMRLYQK